VVVWSTPPVSGRPPSHCGLQSGPDTGLINKAAASGPTVDSWTIMPFDFGGAGQNMGTLTMQAADGVNLTRP